MSTIIIKTACTEFGQTFTVGQRVASLGPLQDYAMVLSGLAEYSAGSNTTARWPDEGIIPITTVMFASPAAYGLDQENRRTFTVGGERYWWANGAWKSGGAVQGGGIPDASSLTLTTAMANSTRLPAGTQTYTIDAATAWSVSDGVAIFLPASGTVSFAVSGGPTINGASTTLTRTLAGNASGYVVLNRIAGAAAYYLTGA